jgi:uncharacterized integral membrane protein
VGGALLKWLVLLVVVTTFALSNRTPVTVSFWQWPIFNGPLATVIVGAAVIGALLTYVSSVSHHLRQTQQIRSLQESVRAREARPGQATPAPAAPAQTSAPRTPPTLTEQTRPPEDTRRLP